MIKKLQGKLKNDPKPLLSTPTQKSCSEKMKKKKKGINIIVKSI